MSNFFISLRQFFLNEMSINSTSDCLEWWCDNEKTVLALEIIAIILCIVGGLGNIITVLAICFSSLRTNINCILIGSLSFAGFLYCGLILPLQAVIFHRHSQAVPQAFCSAAGGIRYTLVGTITVHLGIIALYRYLNVVQLPQYQRLAQTRPLLITISIGWILPLLFTVPPAFGIWGRFTFVPAVLACTFDTHIEQSNRIATVTCGFIVPCIFIIFCYARIGCVAYGSSKRVGQWHGNVSQTRALRLSAMMLCIFGCYFLGTFPYFIVNVYDRTFSQPLHHLWTTVLGWILYCINPIVYTVMDHNFRTAYRRFLLGDCEKSPLRRGNTATYV